ncbi:hypothetical protein CR513_52408, partial [Mucuna pruriens]
MCCFGLLMVIVLNNGTQFASWLVVEFRSQLKIQITKKVGRSQRKISRGTLFRVLCSYHTTPHSTTKENPFRLMFSTMAMIPIKIRVPSPCAVLFQSTQNEEEMRAKLNPL